jgi:hypothetical protein
MEDKKSFMDKLSEAIEEVLPVLRKMCIITICIVIFLVTAYRLELQYDNIWTKILMAVEFFALLGYVMK